MKKKIIIIAIVVLLLVGGGLSYWFLKGKPASKQKEKTTVEKTVEWNPYSTESHHQVTLSDQLLSAGNGDYVVKMSVTLDFKDSDALGRYEGYKDKKESDKAAKSGGEGESSSKVVTPMQLKINDAIGELMMKANDEQLKNRTILKSYLKDGINHKLGFEEPVVKEVFIENFVIQ